MADNTRIVITAVDQTQAAIKTAQDGFAKLGNAVSGLGISFAGLTALGSAAGFVGLVSNAISMAASFKDMSEKTGASVESLSALSGVARITGTDMAVVENTMIRFTKALAGGDDEAKSAGRALEALGLKAADLRNLDPGQALQVLARRLNEFSDGSGKTALAIDLLGRSGAQALPYLKDLAEAGEIHGKVTREQALAADQLEKNIRALNGTFGSLGKQLAMDVVPQLLMFSEQLLKGREIAGGWLSAIYEFGFLLDPTKGLPSNLRDTRVEMAQLNAEIAAGKRANLQDGGSNDLSGEVRRVELLQRRLEFLKLLERQQVQSKYGGEQFLDARDLALKNGKVLNYTSTTEKAAKPEKGLSGTFSDYNDRINQAVAGAISGSAVVKSRELAAEIDALDKLFFDAGLDADIYASALDKLTGATSSAGKESTRLNDLLAATPTAKLEESRRDMQLLAEALEAGRISEEQFTEAASARLNLVNDHLKEARSISEQLGMTFTSAFEDAIVGGKKFSEVLNSIGQDIVRILMRKNITEPLANAIGKFDWSSLLPSANGNVFAGAGIGAYSGQVVSQPTLFPFASGIGLMGEAGPEAILPLTRRNGKLGVEGGGGNGAPSVAVNVINQTGTNATARQQGAPSWDGAQWVISVVMDRAATDPGFRAAFGMGR